MKNTPPLKRLEGVYMVGVSLGYVPVEVRFIFLNWTCGTVIVCTIRLRLFEVIDSINQNLSIQPKTCNS